MPSAARALLALVALLLVLLALSSPPQTNEAQAQPYPTIAPPILGPLGWILPFTLRDATPTPSPTPTPIASARIASSTERGVDGYHYVYLDVQNDGQSILYFPSVTLAYVNSARQIIAISAAYTVQTMLRPGESSSVRLASQPQGAWTAYYPAISYARGAFYTYVHGADGLDQVGVTSRREGQSEIISGRIANNTGRTIEFMSVEVAIFRRSDGAIIGSAAALQSPYGQQIAPGGSVAFEQAFYDYDGNRFSGGYTYAVRPEAALSPNTLGLPPPAERDKLRATPVSSRQ